VITAALRENNADIFVTQATIWRFFFPHGRHNAPMAVKFRVEESTVINSSTSNFTPSMRAWGQGHWGSKN